jgi:AcrR family transcriptional regulator
VAASHPISPNRPAATRRRGTALQNALLDAAWTELQSVGYAKLTMERVADRADTSRAVIYRRWSSRHQLVIAALLHQQPTTTSRIPDTGSLRDDVLTIMRRAAHRISDIGPATVVGLLNDLMADDTSDTIIDQLARGGAEIMNQALARAAARGEARDHVPDRVARLPLDLIRHELILTHRPPSNDTLQEIVDQIFLPLVAPDHRGSEAASERTPQLGQSFGAEQQRCDHGQEGDMDRAEDSGGHLVQSPRTAASAA